MPTTATEPDTLAALWSAVGAHPEDQLPRKVLADHYDELAGLVKCGECHSGQVYGMGVCSDGIMRNHWQECHQCDGTGTVSNGNAEMAEALRATADRVPAVLPARFQLDGREVWSWALWRGSRPATIRHIGEAVWAELRGTPDTRSPSWKDYPTALDAIIDLCRAWVKVNKGVSL